MLGQHITFCHHRKAKPEARMISLAGMSCSQHDGLVTSTLTVQCIVHTQALIYSRTHWVGLVLALLRICQPLHQILRLRHNISVRGGSASTSLPAPRRTAPCRRCHEALVASVPHLLDIFLQAGPDLENRHLNPSVRHGLQQAPLGQSCAHAHAHAHACMVRGGGNCQTRYLAELVKRIFLRTPRYLRWRVEGCSHDFVAVSQLPACNAFTSAPYQC
jgi:hypothetical protein